MIPTDSAAFRRLVLEAAAIVGSILLAFAIDAWWDEFQDAVDTRENLVDVRMEFLEYEAELERRYELWSDYAGSMGRLLDVARSGEAPPAVVMDTLLHDLTWASTFDPGTGAVDALIASGRMEFVRSLELRSAVAAWDGVAAEVQDNEVLARDFITMILLPYLAERGIPLSRVLAVGREDRWPDGRAPDSEARAAYAALVRDPAFGGHVAHRYSLLSLDEYREALDFVRRLLAELDAELGLD